MNGDRHMTHMLLMTARAALVGLSLVPTVQAATIVFSTSAPTTGADDVFSLVGTTEDATNVGNGDNASTYVAFDRAALGQTFTTGSNPFGYVVNSVSLQHVSYSSTHFVTNNPNSQFQIRITNPSQANSAGFILHREYVTLTGTETNTFGQGASADGTGRWVTFTFDTPVDLLAGTTYGFDVLGYKPTTGFPNIFFESNGTNNQSAYTGGTAYSGSLLGDDPNAPNDLTFIPRDGDHTFIVGLTAQVPEPGAWMLLISALACGLLVRRRHAR